MRSSRVHRFLALFGALAVILAQATLAQAVNPNTGTTATDQTLSISIDSPADGSAVPVPPGQVTVTGTVGISPPPGANVYYMVDVSTVTSSPTGADCNGDGAVTPADDFNGDLTVGDVLDCELSGVLALNSSLTSTTVDVGLGIFGGSGSAGDVGPGAGFQIFTSPSADVNGNGIPDIPEMATSADQSQIDQFTPVGVSGAPTDFDAALAVINTSFASVPLGERNVAFLLSQGSGNLSQGLGSALQTAADAGTTVNTFSVGTVSAGCGTASPLSIIAVTTGGTCTEVTDPSELNAAPSLAPATIDRVEVAVNGGTPVVASLDMAGNYSADLSGLVLGSNTIVATVFADDGTAVSADITVTGVAPTNAPPVVNAGGDRTGVEGAAVFLDGTVADPEDTPTTLWSFVAGTDVDPGATCSFADPASVDTSVACTDDGTYTLSLSATDGQNPTVVDTAVLTLINAPPTVNISSPADGSRHRVGSSVEVRATFVDPGSNDSHTCSIDWGDGSVSPGIVESGTCLASHTYSSPGTRTVTVTITDDDLGVGSADIDVVILSERLYDVDSPDGTFDGAGVFEPGPDPSTGTDPDPAPSAVDSAGGGDLVTSADPSDTLPNETLGVAADADQSEPASGGPLSALELPRTGAGIKLLILGMVLLVTGPGLIRVANTRRRASARRRPSSDPQAGGKRL